MCTIDNAKHVFKSCAHFIFGFGYLIMKTLGQFKFKILYTLNLCTSMLNNLQ